MADRGKFILDKRDQSLMITCDCPCDGGKNQPESYLYTKHEHGRLLSFPRYSLPYTKETIRDLARYGFQWHFDGSFLGAVSCVFCNLRILDYNPHIPAAAWHLTKNPVCSLIQGSPTENVRRRNVLFEQKFLARAVKYDAYELELMDILENPYKKREPMNPLPQVVEKLKDIRDLDRREKRRKSFPAIWKYPVDVEDLVLYGFKWLGEDDSVQCDACGLKIKNFQVDDLAAVLHAKNSAFCPYMTAI
jgi:hypothetical protein